MEPDRELAVPDRRAGDSIPRHRRGGRWVSVLLTCLSWTFPFYWLAHCLLNVLPSLIRASLLGYRLEYLRISVLDGMAVAVPVGAASHFSTASGSWVRFGLLEWALLAAAFLLIYGIARRTPHFLAGLLAAVLANTAISTYWRIGASGSGISFSIVAASLVFVVIQVVGLSWILHDLPAENRCGRISLLFASFVLPLALLHSLPALIGFRWFPLSWLALASLPGAGAALLAGI